MEKLLEWIYLDNSLTSVSLIMKYEENPYILTAQKHGLSVQIQG